jgi:hypothetical protein
MKTSAESDRIVAGLWDGGPWAVGPGVAGVGGEPWRVAVERLIGGRMPPPRPGAAQGYDVPSLRVKTGRPSDPLR